MVTYHFPPVTSAGVYRLTGLVKYLRRAGWQVHVLTVARSLQEQADVASLEAIPPDVAVTRTISPEPAARLGRATAPAPGATSGAAAAGADGRRPVWRRVLRRPARWLFDALSYPDFQIGWAPVVAYHVLRHVRRHPRAVVLSSTPPHSTQLGVRLARAFVRFTWVADFRDPWTAPLRVPKGRINLSAQRAMETWVLRACDHAIVNTPGNRAALLAAFPWLDATRVSTVTNGFDAPDPIPPAAPADADLACDVAYFGEIYPEMLEHYLEGVAWLVRHEPSRAPRLHVFGKHSQPDRERVRAAGLDEHIVFMGTVPYARSVSLMRAAPSLLVLLPPGDAWRSCVPSKLYAYLFAARPVLAIAPAGDATRVIEETGAGVSVEPGEPDAVGRGIADFVAAVRSGRARSRAGESAAARRYAFSELAGRVDEILRAAAGGEGVADD
ncbi:MAG: hypothetical protein OEO21_07380 [Candidatus Krumholzibacteria bacterium]|nr:hypothetical protein [Candidatus Krumholzibacteria bacterium]